MDMMSVRIERDSWRQYEDAVESTVYADESFDEAIPQSSNSIEPTPGGDKVLAEGSLSFQDDNSSSSYIDCDSVQMFEQTSTFLDRDTRKVSVSFFWTAMQRCFMRDGDNSNHLLGNRLRVESEEMNRVGSPLCSSVSNLFEFASSLALPCFMRGKLGAIPPVLLDREGAAGAFASAKGLDKALVQQLLAIHDIYELCVCQTDVCVALGWWHASHPLAAPAVMDVLASLFHPLLFNVRRRRIRYLWQLVKNEIAAPHAAEALVAFRNYSVRDSSGAVSDDGIDAFSGNAIFENMFV